MPGATRAGAARPMSGSVRASDRPSPSRRRSILWAGVLTAGLSGLAVDPVAADANPPQRVVSMNFCTDQLALMLAEPGQLVSVSYLAARQAVPDLAEAARALPANHGLAEEIYLLNPDLVVTGRFSAAATVAMLERLGIPVLRLEPESNFDDIEASLRAMGAALGRAEEAEARITRFRADRAAVAALLAARRGADAPAQRAALYTARGWMPGGYTLAGAVMREAGLASVADEMGLTWGGVVPLESLILSDPDLLILGREGQAPRPGWSEAQALLGHPALRAMPAYQRGPATIDSDWVCGVPQVLEAVAELITLTNP